ncbi:MAG: aminomethyl-transferring glycine dehydrogenase subunit GcvPB, partial [Planctomycetota bacterium]|jgi:glycine dehydrogenase subunit 2
MITNPNTVGVFDEQIADIADILHARGAQLYLDGANLNAMLGKTLPGDFGTDVMHFNTHKTFGTPHGGGGPGAGPVAVAEHLRQFLPVPQVVRRDDGTYTWRNERPKSIGKTRSFFGQIGVLVRTYAYIRALGHDGLYDVAEKSVLAANYVAVRLKDRYQVPFPPPYAHEFIMVPKFPDTQVTEHNIAKRLIDHGIHPPTMSWPIPHCLMVEPTETESLATLDRFVEAMLDIADEIENDPETVLTAPHTAPIKRLDEVAASRKPNVRWRRERV